MTGIKQKAFWIAVGDFGGRGFAFLTSIYLARSLGAEYYGLITVAVAILGYASWFADLGLITIGVREIAKEPQKRQFRAREIFNLKVALGAAVMLLSTMLVYLIPMEFYQQQVILGYLYSLIPYTLLMEWYFNGTQEFGKVALSRIINNALYFTLVFFFIQNSADVTLVPILYTVGVMAAVVVLGTFSVMSHPFVQPSRSFQTYKELLKRSSIIGMGDFFSRVVQLLPPIIIGIFLSLKDAGTYGAAFRIIIIAMMLDRIFVNLLIPNLSSLWQSNKENAIQRMDMVFRLVIVGGCLITILTAINAELIIKILFGSGYSESVSILQILSLFILLTFLNSLFSFGLLATGNDNRYFMATAIGGSISAIIIVLFASFGTANWVALAVVFAELLLSFSSYIWFKKIIPISIFRSIFIMLSATGILFFISYYFHIHFSISTILAIIILPLTSWYTGIIRSGELHWAKDKLMR